MTDRVEMETKTRGFTLIELMVTVAVVAILAAVAYPSYIEQVRKSRRADAKAALVAAAQLMERSYTETNSYSNATIGDAANNTFPDHAPADRPHADRTYDISFGTPTTQTANSYTLTARRAGSQASDTACGDFTLTNTGLKGMQNGGTVSKCW